MTVKTKAWNTPQAETDQFVYKLFFNMVLTLAVDIVSKR